MIKISFILIFLHSIFQRISIALQCVLAFVIKKKIVLVGDVYFKPFITFRSHNLHENNIKTIVDEKTSYHERD